MTAFCISDPEFEALSGLPHLPFRMYVVLRRWMDFATGMVGARRRISWQGLAEYCETEASQGRAADQPSRSALRHAAGVLERAGLLRAHSVDGALIFSMPLAETGVVRPEKVRQTYDRMHDTGTAEQIHIKNNDLRDSAAGGAAVQGGEVQHSSGFRIEIEKPEGYSSSSKPESVLADQGAMTISPGLSIEQLPEPSSVGDVHRLLMAMGWRLDSSRLVASCSELIAPLLRAGLSKAVLVEANARAREKEARSPLYVLKVTKTVLSESAPLPASPGLVVGVNAAPAAQVSLSAVQRYNQASTAAAIAAIRAGRSVL